MDESETKKLHDSVDFSLNEGKYVLKDISLNAKYLTEKLAVSAPGLSIRKATIERLEINLTLRENSHDETAQTDAAAQSSLAWRAMKLGTTNASLPAVSLVAEIKVHGVDLELEPCECKRRPPTTPEPVAVEDTNAEFSSKSVIGSYVNAALASLQLSLKLTKINIKLCHKNGEKETWVALRLSSVSYKDLDVAGNNISNSSGSKIVLNKSIDFSEITIQAGELYLGNDEVCRKLSSRQSTVALAKGTGNIYVRLIQYLKDQKQGPTEDNLHLQQDIEVNMNHQMNLSVDKTSIVYLRDIADGFANISETDLEEDEFLEPVPVPFACNPHFAMDEATDQEDLKAITGIMKQYREAYHLAEQNQLRGGILVPTNAYLEVGETHKEEDDTFDVFFDANDQSFYHAASVLAESVRMLDDRPTDDDEHIHTNFKMHLLSGCFKIVFREPDGHLPKPDEYVLMTLDEMNLFMSSSHRTSQLSLNIAHFEVEDAQLDKTKTTPSCFSVGDSQAYEGTVEIGSLLGFISVSSSPSPK